MKRKRKRKRKYTISRFVKAVGGIAVGRVYSDFVA